MNSLQVAENFWSQVCFNKTFKPQGRYQVYRELVTERMLDVLQNIAPVAKSILKAKEWKILLWDFLKNSTLQSEILRDLPWEVAQYLKNHPHPLAKKYPYLGELIEYEFLEIKMQFAPEDEGHAPTGKLRLNPAHHLARYRWPVHCISEEFSKPRQLPLGEYYLLLWRHPKTLEVKFMEVNALVASVIRILEGGAKSEKVLLRTVAKENELEDSAKFRKEGEELLAELTHKGIFLNNLVAL